MFSIPLGHKEAHLIPSLATVSISTIGGGILGGVPGALVGLCSSIADEILIHYNIEKKHYISSTLFWNHFTIYPFTSEYFPSLSSPAKQAISYSSAFALSYFTDDFLNLNDKLNPAVESFSVLNRIANPNQHLDGCEESISWKTFCENPTKQLQQIYKKTQSTSQNPLYREIFKVLSFSTFGVIADFYLNIYLGRYAKSLLSPLLEKHAPLGPSYLSLKTLPTSYLMEGLKFATALLLKSVLKQGVHFSQTQMRVKLAHKTVAQITKCFFEGQNGQEVKNSEAGEEISQNIINDSNTIVNESLKVDVIIRQLLSAGLSLSLLNKKAPWLISPYLLLLVPIQAAYTYLVDSILKVKKEYLSNKMKFYMFNWISTNQMQQIKLRDGEKFMQNKLELYSNRDQKLTAKERTTWNLKNNTKDTISLIHNFIDLFFLIYPVAQNKVDIEDILPIKEAIDAFSIFFSSNLLAKMDQSDLTLSLGRIKKLFDIIEQPSKKTVTRLKHSKPSLSIQDYSLRLEGEELISTQNLDFEMGKRYALTGPSGCGKSSFLIDLKLGLIDPFTPTGKFLFPTIEGRDAKMLFLDQDLFLLPETTLIENILFPNIFEDLNESELQEYEERILALFDELQIDSAFDSSDEEAATLSTKLHSKSYKLSGGQRKKIGLIQAIFSKPDILFLDETFAGLDENSRQKCQEAIKKYLPKSLILVVDHHLEDNNKDHFYDANVDFSNQTISMQLL